MARFLIIYAALCFAFFLGWLISSLFAAGKIKHLEAELRALHLLRDEENKSWFATLVRSVAAHKKFQSQDGGAS